MKEYAERHAKFPNESTGDPFFDENQFESYRELGRHIGLKVFAPLINTSALLVNPKQIRDALPDRLPDHPALQARQKNGRGDKPAPTNEAPTVNS